MSEKRRRASTNEADLSAYYSRESGEQSDLSEPAFAPPPKMTQFLSEEEGLDEPEDLSGNVYHTRSASWVDEDERMDAMAESELGYQVREVRKKKKRKRRHRARGWLIALGILLALLACALLLMPDQVAVVFITTPTEEPFVPVVTPEPVKPYDAAPQAAISGSTRTAISRLSGSVEMETHIVTDTHIVTRNRRQNGTYDFYLFTADSGRLLCYFEGLGPQDMIPLKDGGFYVSQAPYLIAANGSAMIRTADLEAQLGEALILHPLMNGWAVAESAADGSANYLDRSAHLLSDLWFSRTFPFTGQHTVAYVDTGADTPQRFLLYVLGADGSMTKWLSAAEMTDVVVSAAGMAYMADGSLYHLPDTSKPLLQTPEVHAYLDCDALVVRDAETGKYGLFVHGEQHYDFAYDSIQPLESDIRWAEKTLTGEGGSFTVHAVHAYAYPQPLSHSFVLTKDGRSEYVALSTQSSCPIRLEGEF